MNMDISDSIRDEFLRAAYRFAMVGFSIDEARLLLEAQYQIEAVERRVVDIGKPPDEQNDAHAT